MPYITTFFIQNGIPEQTLVWLFILPLAITLVVIGRQVVGIRGLGVSAPILLGFAFASTGLQFGAALFAAVLGAAYLAKSGLSGIRLLYLPKIALLLLAALVVAVAAASFLPYGDEVQFPLATFGFIVVIFSAEQFSSILVEQGPRKMLGMAIETLALSAGVFFLVSSPAAQNAVLAYPLFVLLAALALNVLLGKWTGLRLSEYIRFKNIVFK